MESAERWCSETNEVPCAQCACGPTYSTNFSAETPPLMLPLYLHDCASAMAFLYQEELEIVVLLVIIAIP